MTTTSVTNPSRSATGDPHRRRRVPSPVGPLTLVASGLGLRAVLWPDDEGRVPLPDAVKASAEDELLDRVESQLAEYFVGRRTGFDLPLDLRGTEFQVLAWGALAEIPYGETVSYAEQARRIGRPRSVRAIGAATGRNPVSIVLPCHRVVAADGSLHGFAGGLDAKAWLLDHERAHRR